ncbi:endonuclease/exonuclease/phosphatase family protein [uncultured Bacteroides sp.]|uniref:endonuclease/exonuclease/phosphatase family protein n=1 Tax=uncultured Bacteroides sp. TaxID=162156 RepID=UPI002AA909C5|nr:endonuclease/exonuclease/phosphatase family protein [uncultured Bacteroides sp.]
MRANFFHYFVRTITFILACLAIAGTFARYISPIHSSLLPLLGMLLPVLITLNLIIAIYWVIRRRYWMCMPILAIALNFSYLNCIFQISLGEKVLLANHKSLKVATYNVHSFGNEFDGFSCKKIARYMNDQKVDIICFQEFAGNNDFTIDSIKQALSAWKYSVIVPYNELNLIPLAVFSKYSITNSRLITYPGSRNCSLWCDIIINGKKLRLFNNHLQTTNMSTNRKDINRALQETGNTYGESEALIKALTQTGTNFIKRAQQAETVRKLVAESPYPVLLCGDLNSTPSSYTYHTVKSNLLDGFQTSGRGYAYTYRFYKHLLRIDYIFHSPELQGVNYFSPDINLCSDHNPVIMEVGVPL